MKNADVSCDPFVYKHERKYKHLYLKRRVAKAVVFLDGL